MSFISEELKELIKDHNDLNAHQEKPDIEIFTQLVEKYFGRDRSFTKDLEKRYYTSLAGRLDIVANKETNHILIDIGSLDIPSLSLPYLLIFPEEERPLILLKDLQLRTWRAKITHLLGVWSSKLAAEEASPHI